MSCRTELRFRRGDMLAILAVAAMIACVWLLFIPRGGSEANAVVEVYRDGELIVRLPLDEDGEYTVEGKYTNKLSIKDGRVSMTWSDCPGGDCLHSGAISSVGRSIVCLPNRVEVRINGAEEAGEVDFVVG